MADKEKKIDPYDVEALEKSLNDSATRVSTIWVSFLIFSLYLLTAAATVTHRQLFLAEPLKLPVLNIELPLWGFFILAPILFVIFHAYVLIQVILLARTAAAYDCAVKRIVDRDSISSDEEFSFRQRLANTLFAQIFAGSSREREGAFGWLLKMMAWITLAISPILILLTFQFMFLPYHSPGATWTHRVLILLEFTVAFQLWPLILNPRQDFPSPNWRAAIGGVGMRLRSLMQSREGRLQAWHGFRRRTIPLGACLLFVLLSLWLASFPGELHVNLITGQPRDAVQCDRWLHRNFGQIDLGFYIGPMDLRMDRLSLRSVDIVDDEKLEKIERAFERTGEPPYQSERTRTLAFRDLNCADLRFFADLRHVDLNGASLREADLLSAKLQGASLLAADLRRAKIWGARLQGANLTAAQLHDAQLEFADLRGAALNSAWLPGANLQGVRLDGASLNRAKMQGASLKYAWLPGASLVQAQLQGASLDGAWLPGATLNGVQLQGASLNRAHLQGAVSFEAQLQGASLEGTELQGAVLLAPNLAQAVLSGAQVWRAENGLCTNARVIAPRTEAVIGERQTADGRQEIIPTTSEEIEEFVTSSVAGIPDAQKKKETSDQIRRRLAPDPMKDAALANFWQRCEIEAIKVSQDEFDDRLVAVLRETVCENAQDDGVTIGKGVARNWLSGASERRRFSTALARALLGEDGKPCAAAQSYDDSTRKQLRDAASWSSQSAPSVPK